MERVRVFGGAPQPRFYLGRTPTFRFPCIRDRKSRRYASFATEREALLAIVKIEAGVLAPSRLRWWER